MKRVAIQGIRGSFHDIAAHQYFLSEELEIVCCSSFEQVFDCVRDDPSIIAFAAIENTIAGSLLHNYELLRDSGLSIVGEHKLHISHSLVCLPEDDWDSLCEVDSHPVALMQCRSFLQNHPQLKVVQRSDTASSARAIAEEQLRGHCAICHKDNAALYGLKILEEEIEDNKHNFTRFLLCSNSKRASHLRHIEDCNKASLVFTLPHKEGSLSQALSVLSFYDINLTKIQSLPIIGKEWEYMFYIDVVYPALSRFRQGIAAISPLTSELRVLGEYIESKETNL
ncbi:MAG: prephenate dehydratase [Bacteroidales bacterium]|nr:prephenate dehydratase [Bacteroidales bacterium]